LHTGGEGRGRSREESVHARVGDLRSLREIDGDRELAIAWEAKHKDGSQGLKPRLRWALSGTAEAVPFHDTYRIR